MINDIIFQGEQSIKWDDVRTYIKNREKWVVDMIPDLHYLSTVSSKKSEGTT